jgi:hypothetical protein
MFNFAHEAADRCCNIANQDAKGAFRMGYPLLSSYLIEAKSECTFPDRGFC